MNTPAHLIFGVAAFGTPGRAGVTSAALIGGALPDLSLYLLFAWESAKGTSPQVIFDQLYFSDAWMQVFAIDNSFVIWGLLCAFALWRKSAWGVALCGAALLHLACDFPLHVEDARPHFWPLSDWKFHSPVSYWDRAHYGGIVAPIEVGLCLGLTVLIWRRFRAWWVRGVTLALAMMELVPMVLFAVMSLGQ